MTNEKRILWDSLKKIFNITDDSKIQSAFAKSELLGCTPERWLEYKQLNEYFNGTEEDIILHAPTLNEGLLQVVKKREDTKNEKEELKKAWINKYKALEKDLQEVCKKHGAVLLKGDSLYESVDAPYAEELNINFCFGIDIDLAMEGVDDIEFKESDWKNEN